MDYTQFLESSLLEPIRRFLELINHFNLEYIHYYEHGIIKTNGFKLHENRMPQNLVY